MKSDLLPNCLTETPRVDRNIPLPGTWFYLFCANCGKDTYRVMATELPAEYAFALCNDCVDKWGEPAGVARTPDDVFRVKVEQAMAEKYGHALTEFEILQALEDSSSCISKLEKESLRR